MPALVKVIESAMAANGNHASVMTFSLVKMTWSILDSMNIEIYELLENGPNFTLNTWGQSQNWCSYALNGRHIHDSKWD